MAKDLLLKGRSGGCPEKKMSFLSSVYTLSLPSLFSKMEKVKNETDSLANNANISSCYFNRKYFDYLDLNK